MKNPVGSIIEPGTVQVGIRTETPVERAWLALRDPARLAQWFGALDQPWLPGRQSKIDFGDGDFFDVVTDKVSEHKLLAFTWRFLGVGRPAHIRWNTTVVPDGTLVEVEDSDPHRNAAQDEEQLAGWTDFLTRLRDHLATGKPTRYQWRDDIDGSVDLPKTSFDPFAPDTLIRWLPVATDGFALSWFFVIDDDGPRRFAVSDWCLFPGELTFRVQIPQAVTHTPCQVRLDGRTLSFRHTGWRRLGLSPRQSMTLRRRFTATWVAALAHALAISAPEDPFDDR